MLSSLIRPRRKAKGQGSKSPFTIRRIDSPRSPHPYASPEIFHITPIQSQHSYDDEDSEQSAHLPVQSPPTPTFSPEDDIPSPQLTPIRPRTPPRVKLDIDISPNGLSDWIPSHLLDSKIYAAGEVPLLDQSPGASSSRLPQESSAAAGSAEPSQAAAVATQQQEVEDEDVSVYGGDDGYDDSSYSDDIVANLEAMDATTFVNAPDAPPHSTRLHAPSIKKSAPSPIKIPNVALHGPKVQVIRSSGGQKRASQSGFSPSRPESIYSGEDGSANASAVSGTTLARALISNSFVLSTDDRAARYRSGGSVLTRMDSATLPRDESVIGSPLTRDRKLSGNSDLLSPPDTIHSLIPLPSNADAVYVPPRQFRRSNTESREKKRKRRSTGSILSRSDTEGSDAPMPSLVRSNSSGSNLVNIDLNQSRRISRISEATSSTSLSTPDHLTPNDGLSPGSSSFYAPSPLSGSLSGPVTGEAETSQRPGSQSNVSSLSPTSSSDPAQRPISSTSSSTKEYDVLDYYSLSPAANGPGASGSPVQEGQTIPIQLHEAGPFRPPFSPISEESSSQLSPPTPYKRNSRASVSSSGSPSKGRMERAGFRTDSQSQAARLLPIGENPQSQRAGPSTSSKPTLASLAGSNDLHTTLAPPSNLFNRQRSGSAPSPIRVVRDSRDLNTYNITVTPRPLSSSGSTPTTGGSGEYVQLQQTFPETPNAFSPMWSAGVSPGMPGASRGSMDQILLAVPPTPMTAGAVSGREIMPTLAQQMLTRAATSVRGARHSNQPSFSRARTVAQHLHGVGATLDVQTAPHSAPPDSEPEVEDSEERDGRRTYPSWITQRFSTSDSEGGEAQSPSHRSEETTSVSMYSQSGESPSAQVLTHQVNEHLPHEPSTSSSQGLTGGSTSTAQTNTLNASQTSLNVRTLPQPPPSPSIFGTPINTVPTPLPGLPAAMNSSSSLIAPSVLLRIDRSSPSVTSSPSLSQQDLTRPPVPAPVVVTPPPPPIHQVTPPQDSHSEHLDSVELEIGAASVPSIGSPPPYYTLVFEQNHIHQDSLTPSTGGPSTGSSNVDSDYRFRALSPNSPTSIRDDHNSSRQSMSSVHRRGRSRPPLPIGPRRPTPTNLGGTRQRNASISSVASNLPTARLRSHSTALKSPRFQSPAPKWRGYTMDAAKWTFTSSQLQAIVSRAIKLSAEASAIRLLRLETVDTEIPNELHRLEMQRTDIKTRYKMMARKRTDMLETLTAHLDGATHQDSAATLRLVGELGDVSVSLDRLAEDLHSVDEQIAQLTSLRDVHDASALAMALRKLNASFLKQLSITDAMRQQIVELEAERDDGWKQAENVAQEYDRLNEKVNSADGPPSNRSSRVTAMRKSSIRAYKAGLRSARSSSMSSSNRLSIASLSGAKSAFSVEDIPPVPPIPRHRPIDIMTDLPITRSSAVALSTEGPTPNSETRAMVRAHEELCEMLGITMNDIRPRRSRSVIERASEVEVKSPIHSNRSSNGRPISMPDNSGLSEVYQAMTADRNAILATLGLLSDTS